MPIKVSCTCGKTFNAHSKYAGKKVKCPECKQPLTIPSETNEGAIAEKGQDSSSLQKAIRIAVKCSCGKSFQAKPELVGRTVKCPACSQPLKIQTVKEKSKAITKEKDVGSVSSPMDSLFDEVGLADDGTVGRKCPECRSLMKAEAILCIQCGYNENLGRKMKVNRPVTAADRANRAGKRSRS